MSELLNKSPLYKRSITFISKDDMIENFYIDNISSLNKFLGNTNVFLARLRISAWVVVRDDYICCRLGYCSSEYFSNMNDT